MKKSKSNVDILSAAGICETERLTKAELKAINSLTEEEVAAIKSAFNKIARVGLGGKTGGWRGFCF